MAWSVTSLVYLSIFSHCHCPPSTLAKRDQTIHHQQFHPHPLEAVFSWRAVHDFRGIFMARPSKSFHQSINLRKEKLIITFKSNLIRLAVDLPSTYQL